MTNISNIQEYKKQACDDEILVTKHQQRTKGYETNKKKMDNKTGNNMQEDEMVFPDGKIILLDGRTLNCYPLAEGEEAMALDDSLKLDRTGEYLSLNGKAKSLTPSQPTHDKYEEVRKELFLKNAFYLLAHKERILADSRMFLCPVHIQNGLIYTGTSGFQKPTLGIYIEWWLNCDGAIRTDKDGRRSLVYSLGGSPLSGMNRCGVVNENGKKESVSLSSFINYWPLFMKVNRRYTEAKGKYQAYDIKQVLDILDQEDNGNFDYAHAIDTVLMTHEIIILNKRVENLKRDRDHWYAKHQETLMRYNDEKIRMLYAEYEELESKVNAEIDGLREQKKELKAKLKRGVMDNVAYQKQLTPINRRIGGLEHQLAAFKYNRVREVFPDGDVTFNLMVQHMSNIRKSQNDE